MGGTVIRGWTVLILVSALALFGSQAIEAQASQTIPASITTAPKQCPAGAPGLAANVSWQPRSNYKLVMANFVKVANCRNQIKAVRIKVEAYRTGGQGFVNSATIIRQVSGKTIGYELLLRAIFEQGNSGPLRSFVFEREMPKKPELAMNVLQSCTKARDGVAIDMTDFEFIVRVEPLGSNRKVIRDVGAAVLGPFPCGVNIGTT